MEEKPSLTYEALTAENSSSRFCIGFKARPCCRSFLGHGIRTEIPLGFQRLVRLMLLNCYYVAFFLLVNCLAEVAAFCAHTEFQVDETVLLVGLCLSVLWLVLFTALSFRLYKALYKALADRRPGHYRAFFWGTVAEVLVCVFIAGGVPCSGFMGLFMVAVTAESFGTCLLSFLVTAAFTLDAVFLAVALVKVHAKHRRMAAAAAANEMVTEESAVVSAKVGTLEALPSEVGGRKVSYLPVSAGRPFNSKVERLSALPENSFTVVAEWKEVGASPEEEEDGGSYILYVENEPERAYWSTPQVAGILNSGLVNPATQVLTLSRLPGGSFAFGVADKW